ncbi:hypothetical protein CUJ84_Chr003128 [Rhizobium leguminosarum]|uniref:Uncharacterized protein n=1 Tax=Rhizobium leguminosarum TaxID=384 RepID=A0A2K9Z5L2_RHILE|nr:hypothetical protein CUJ84_Chr003128 [Rhizobium leguminosarum]
MVRDGPFGLLTMRADCRAGRRGYRSAIPSRKAHYSLKLVISAHSRNIASVSAPEIPLSREHLHFLAAILAICSDQSNGDRPVHDQEIRTSSYCRKLSQRLHDDRSLYR